jgi:phosphoribosyl 1,2-cyclic phosphodiesterase
MEKELALRGLRPRDLAGVFLTHEHSDHVSGLPGLVSKARCPVFAREAAWLALNCLGKVERAYRRLLPMDELNLGDLLIRPFAVPHDAAEPLGFNVFYRRRKLSLATDLGYVPGVVKAAFADSDVIIIEANHDEKMLSEGSYPAFLKARISGRQGHLSNAAAGRLLADVAGGRTKEIFLAHLSEENNRPELALRTVKDCLAERGSGAALYVASQHRPVSNHNGECEVG